VRKVTIIVCILLFSVSLLGCSKKTHNPIIQPQNRISTEELNRFLTKAEQGDASAQYQLGTIYYQGESVPKSYTEALRWYKKAAEQGHADAQFSLGLMYDKGHIGVPKNNGKAYIWYGLASEQGIEDAKRNFICIESLMTTSEITRAEKEAADLRKKIDWE
jgi:Sel1 repeat